MFWSRKQEDNVNEPYAPPPIEVEIWNKPEISLAELTALQDLANNEPVLAVEALKLEYDALLTNIADFCKGFEEIERYSFVKILRASTFSGKEGCWANDRLNLESEERSRHPSPRDYSDVIYNVFEGMIKLPLDYIYNKKKNLLPEMVEWQKNKATLNAVSMAIGKGTLKVVYP